MPSNPGSSKKIKIHKKRDKIFNSLFHHTRTVEMSCALVRLGLVPVNVKKYSVSKVSKKSLYIYLAYSVKKNVKNFDY